MLLFTIYDAKSLPVLDSSHHETASGALETIWRAMACRQVCPFPNGSDPDFILMNSRVVRGDELLEEMFDTIVYFFTGIRITLENKGRR